MYQDYSTYFLSTWCIKIIWHTFSVVYQDAAQLPWVASRFLLPNCTYVVSNELPSFTTSTPYHTKSNYTIHIVTNEHPSFLHCSYLRSPRWHWANQSDGGIGVGSIHCIWHPHDTHHLLFPRYKHNPLSLQAQPQPEYKVSHRVILDLQILSIFMNIMTVFLQLWIPHTINLIRRLIPLYDVCVGLKCERQNKIYKLQLYTFLSEYNSASCDFCHQGLVERSQRGEGRSMVWKMGTATYIVQLQEDRVAKCQGSRGYIRVKSG